MGNGCSKSILLSSPSLLPDTAAAANEEEEESLGVAAAAASVQGTNGSDSVSADSKDNADGDGHHDGDKYILRQVPVGTTSDDCIDLIIGSLSQEVLFQLLLVFRQQCAAERRRMLSPRVDPTTAAAAAGLTASNHNVMPAAISGAVSVGSTSRDGSTKRGGGLLPLLDRSFKRLSLNKDSLYSLFPSIHSRHHRQLICDLLLLYEPLDPSLKSLINGRAHEDIDRFMRSCSLVTPAQLLKAFQVVSYLPVCALLRDSESTSPSEGKDLFDQ